MGTLCSPKAPTTFDIAFFHVSPRTLAHRNCDFGNLCGKAGPRARHKRPAKLDKGANPRHVFGKAEYLRHLKTTGGFEARNSPLRKPSANHKNHKNRDNDRLMTPTYQFWCQAQAQSAKQSRPGRPKRSMLHSGWINSSRPHKSNLPKARLDEPKVFKAILPAVNALWKQSMVENVWKCHQSTTR